MRMIKQGERGRAHRESMSTEEIMIKGLAPSSQLDFVWMIPIALNKRGRESFRAQREYEYKGHHNNGPRTAHIDDNYSDFDSDADYQENLTVQGKFVQNLWKVFTQCPENLLNSRGWFYNFVKKSLNFTKN